MESDRVRILIVEDGSPGVQGLEYMEVEEVIELIRSYPMILPHIRSRDVLVYPEIFSRRGKKFLVATDLSRELSIHPIVLEFFYTNSGDAPERRVGGRRFRRYLPPDPEGLASMIYEELLASIETVNLCRSRAKWVKDLEKWFMNIYRDRDPREICIDIRVEEATLVFRLIDRHVSLAMEELARVLDIHVAATQILKSVQGGRRVYLAYSYIPRRSFERREDYILYGHSPYVM